MSYQFFANFLNFVADRADQQDENVAAQMADLRKLAEVVAAADDFLVFPDDQRRVSRALAGFAAFLQQHILPEALAHGHRHSESQIRWVIDTAMATSTAMLAHVETAAKPDAFCFKLPAPPL